MLVNSGQLNGKRLLSPRTVDLMSSNHVGDLYSGIGQRLKGMGFGLTVEVVMDGVSANRRESNGSFGWDGAFGTHFWVDRKDQLVARQRFGRIAFASSDAGLQCSPIRRSTKPAA